MKTNYSIIFYEWWMFIYQENRRLKMHFAASLCSSYILHVRLLTCNEQ